MMKPGTMVKHFVTFNSPGIFFAEQTTKEIRAWRIDEAQKMALRITERYGATPYGFYFTTRVRRPHDFDSREIAQSGTYYLGGTILTLADVILRGDPRDEILISNMKCNGWDRIIENKNSWKWVQSLCPKDRVLPWPPKEVPCGARADVSQP